MFSLLQNDGLNIENICTMHRMLTKDIDAAESGNYRKINVIIAGTSHDLPAYQDVPELMDKFESWIVENKHKFHPVIYAILLHKELVFIHPFSDGNGRISRLAMNTILLQNGYLPIIVPPILRLEYSRALDATTKNDTQFIKFMLQQEIESQKAFLREMTSIKSHP
ncbi:MAG: Fic family protein [Desulfovibrio sp.]|nr:Fic family protein [Desulfovibrio sp.]